MWIYIVFATLKFYLDLHILLMNIENYMGRFGLNVCYNYYNLV